MAILLLSLSGSKVVSFDNCFFPLHSVTHHFYENFSAAGHDHNQQKCACVIFVVILSSSSWSWEEFIKVMSLMSV